MYNLMASINWNKVEFWAKAYCYPFAILGAFLFLLSTLSSFAKYGALAVWAYTLLWFLWLVCLAFIWVRDTRRTRLQAENPRS